MHRWLFLFLVYALSGCVPWQADQARVTINAWLPPPLTRDMLHVRVTDGSREWALVGADFHSRGGPQHNGPELKTRMRGTLRVHYTLSAPDQQIVSTGSVEIPLKRDWQWGVDIRPDSANPARMCFGCSGSQAFPLHPSYRTIHADSVYVVWGGNSIKHPVIY